MAKRFFESDEDYRVRTALEADERTIENLTGSAPSKGWFESDDEYRTRISAEADERTIGNLTGSAPSKGWFEGDDEYRARISGEADERSVERATGSAPSRGWFESDDNYETRVRKEANESTIEAESGHTPKQGWFEGDHEYRSRIAHEAREIRARVRAESRTTGESRSSAGDACSSDSSSTDSSASGSRSGAGGFIGFVIVAIIIAIAMNSRTGNLPSFNANRSSPPAEIESRPPSIRTAPTQPPKPKDTGSTSYTPPVTSKRFELVPQAQRDQVLVPSRLMAGDRLHVINVEKNDPDQLNVRAGPGQRYKSVGGIPWNGGRIEYLGLNAYNKSDLWVRVRWGDVVGWVNSSYVRLDP